MYRNPLSSIFTTIQTCVEYLAHGYVVEPVGAIEDHTLYSQCLGEILGRLSLARPCRTLWGAIEVEMKGSHQGAVTAIGQWSYNKSANDDIINT